MNNVIEFGPKFVNRVLAKQYDLPVSTIKMTYDRLGEHKLLSQLHGTLQVQEIHQYRVR